MNNVINFPNDYNEFEEMSVTSRAVLIEEWSREMQEQLAIIRQCANEIEALIEANRKLPN